jgi:hypothetical protein
MTKKIVLLACIATLAIGASAQTGNTNPNKGPWDTAPKSHAVGSQKKALSSFDMTRNVGPTAVKRVGAAAPQGNRIGRK